MEANMRECKACGGTGRQVVEWDGGPESPTRYVVEDCPACNGRGTQSDAMPVADALADAETLRFVAAAGDYSIEFQTWVGSPTTLAVNAAIRDADMAVRGARDFAYERAVAAARAAFRACPGLRD